MPREREELLLLEKNWIPSNVKVLEAVLPKDFRINEEQLQRYDRLLYAFGTVEPRAVTLLLAVSDEPLEPKKARHKLKQTLLSNTWIPGHLAITNYFVKALYPTGLVDGDGINFWITPEGRLGQLATTIPLYYTMNHKIPASTIFGFNASQSDNRSPINRSAILMALYQQPSFEAELIRITGMEKGTVKNQLHTLNDLGMVDHSFADMEIKGWGIYERVGDETLIQHQQTRNRLRQNIVKFFRKNERANAISLVQALGLTSGANVTTVLSELVEAGYLARSLWHGGVQQSGSYITKNGIEFVEMVIVPLLKLSALDPEALAIAERLKTKLICNPYLVSQAITHYRDASPRIPREETMQEIIDHIHEHGPTRYKQFVERFGSRVAPIITILAQEGRLVKQRIRKAVFYTFPGSPKPVYTQEDIFIEYDQPENLLPPTCYPKEHYIAQLETVDFWLRIVSDLEHVKTQTVTERDFFFYYSPRNPAWSNSDNYLIGIYTSFIMALKNAGIRYPYTYLREYIPAEDNPVLVEAVRQARAAITEKLIPTVDQRRWQDYLEELHTEEFWRQLTRDMHLARPGIGFPQFLVHFTQKFPQDFSVNSFHGIYSNFYHVALKHVPHVSEFFRNFQPSLPYTEGLTDAINEAKQLMQEKFFFKRRRRPALFWIEALEDSNFWQEFALDIRHFNGQITFGSFLYRFDEENPDGTVRQRPDGKPYLGKYFPLYSAASKHIQLFLDAEEIAQLEDPLVQSVTQVLKRLIYQKAPREVRELLIVTWSKEFGSVERALTHLRGIPHDATEIERDWLVHQQALLQEESIVIWDDITVDDIPDEFLQRLLNHPIFTTEKQIELAKLVEKANRAENASEILGAEVPETLRRIIEEGQAASDQLILSNQKFIVFLIKKYGKRGVPFLDLFSTGNIALLKALRHYDWRRGTNFSSYASFWIQKEFDEAFAKQSEVNPHTLYIRNNFRRVKTAIRLLKREGKRPTLSAISNITNMSIDTIRSLQEQMRPARSLQEPLHDDSDAALEDVVPDATTQPPEQQIMHRELITLINLCLRSNVITRTQAKILRLRMGFDSGKPHSLQEIGRKFHLKRLQVAELLDQALLQIRESSFGDDLEEYLE